MFVLLRTIGPFEVLVPQNVDLESNNLFLRSSMTIFRHSIFRHDIYSSLAPGTTAWSRGRDPIA